MLSGLVARQHAATLQVAAPALLHAVDLLACCAWLQRSYSSGVCQAPTVHGAQHASPLSILSAGHAPMLCSRALSSPTPAHVSSWKAAGLCCELPMLQWRSMAHATAAQQPYQKQGRHADHNQPNPSSLRQRQHQQHVKRRHGHDEQRNVPLEQREQHVKRRHRHDEQRNVALEQREQHVEHRYGHEEQHNVALEQRQQHDQQMQEHGQPGQRTSFAQLGVHRTLINALMAQHIQSPAPVQAAAIPLVASGANVAIQSQTGSGKTLAYLLPLLSSVLDKLPSSLHKNQWRKTFKGVKVLVVTPSHELSMQILHVARALLPQEARDMVQQAVGGANPLKQRMTIAVKKPLVVVGTPGRVANLTRSGGLKLTFTTTLVLDEADRLLADELADDMYTVHNNIGNGLFRMRQRRQTILVSASLRPSSLARLAMWCPHPQLVSADATGQLSVQAVRLLQQQEEEQEAQQGKGDSVDGRPAAAKAAAAGFADTETEDLSRMLAPQLKHFYVQSHGYTLHKLDALRRCVHALDAQRALVFMNEQRPLIDAQHKLATGGMPVNMLHGSQGKHARHGALTAFSRGKLRMLLVTELAARGLDIAGCDAVFNLEMPESALHYAHRAGRTGRMGAPGVVVSIVTRKELSKLQAMAQRLGIKLQAADVSHGQFMIQQEPAAALI